MSIWYQLEVTAIANDISPVAKFFNLESFWEEVRTESFSFSFGGKNAPGLTLWKIIKQHPEMVFLVEQQIEISMTQYFLMDFDSKSDKVRSIFIQDIGDYNNAINKQLLEDYKKAYPGLAEKHFAHQQGYEGFRWSMFLHNFEMSKKILDNAEKYEEMLDLGGFFEAGEAEFDNEILDIDYD